MQPVRTALGDIFSFLSLKKGNKSLHHLTNLPFNAVKSYLVTTDTSGEQKGSKTKGNTFKGETFNTAYPGP